MTKSDRYAKLARIGASVKRTVRLGLRPLDESGYEWEWVPGTRGREHKLAEVNAFAALYGGTVREGQGGRLRASCSVASRLYAYWKFAAEDGGVECQGIAS